MTTYRELNRVIGNNRVNHLLTKMYYQERMGIISQNYDTKLFYIENGNLNLYLGSGNLFLSWI